MFTASFLLGKKFGRLLIHKWPRATMSSLQYYLKELVLNAPTSAHDDVQADLKSRFSI